MADGLILSQYAEFRAYVEPANFKSDIVRKWSERLLAYFEAEIGSNADPFQSTKTVWRNG